ncbi:Alanine--tRNA ligase [Coemansia guatemalensis]|uniref:Alanine--tRNA ligase n=1 Tax=Coemansia guatemalensis TaxID=2761395 RepID=A0A9W8HW38_9FUNG|nr:Alanine--tRNA ligase [Coemansia guatemalensis]
MKVFVTVEESGVAKGIRRIVAVTGEEALKAQLLHRSLAAEIEKLHKLLLPSQQKPEQQQLLESELKRLSKELDAAVIGVYEKHQLRQVFDGIKRQHVEADKAAKALVAKQISEQVHSAIEQNPDQEAFVFRFDAAGKALAQMATYIKGLKNKAAYFISVDESAGRVAHQCVVGKPLVARGLKANEWAEAVSAVVGGKKGGKEESAQGSGSEIARADEAVRVAKDFVKSHLK